MSRLLVGVVGAGLIAQVEHIPNLLRLKDRFEIVGVCDPSPAARSFIAERYGLAVVGTLAQLLARRLDALVVASPDPFHVAHVLEGLAAGLHVFCEKPLCYGPAEADQVIAARERAGRVVQIGYMKRFDPSYEAALELLPDDPDTLRYVSVEVSDPDSWPFVDHHAYRRADDLPASAGKALRATQRAQVRAALGRAPDATRHRGFVGAFCSSLVHDVNLVHGLLDRMRVPDGEPASAQIFAGGDGGSAQVRLRDGRALWNMVHLAVPKLAAYRERVALHFDDRIIELVFPSPYLNHFPTELIVQSSRGLQAETRHVRPSYREAFIRELEAFWASAVESAPVRNTVEHARRDMALISALAKLA